MTSFSPRTFRSTFIFSVLLSALFPMILLIFPMLYENLARIKTDSSKELSLQSENALEGLNLKMEDIKLRSEALARDSDIQRAAKIPLFITKADVLIKKYADDDPAVGAIFFVGPDQKIITAYPVGIETRVSGLVEKTLLSLCDPNLTKAKAENYPYETELSQALLKAEAGPSWLLRIPVFNSQKDSRLGEMCFFESWKSLFQVVTKALPKGSQLRKIEIEGHSLPWKNSFVDSHPEGMEQQRFLQDLRVNMTLLRPESLNSDPVRRRATLWILASVLLLIVVTGVAIKVARFSLKPFDKLYEFVGEFAKGNYRSKAPSVKFKEFQDLSKVLVHMGQEIENHLQRAQKFSELEKSQIKTELESLKNQLRPHFIFNALNGILATLGTSPEKARVAIVQLSELYRRILDSSKSLFHPLKDELLIVDGYLQLEKLRYADRLSFRFSLAPTLNLNSKMPPLLLQTLVENAIKHGIAKSIAGGHIEIAIEAKNSSEGRNLQFYRITNSGQSLNANYKIGTGLENTIKRLDLLFPAQNEFQMRQSSENETTVNFCLPVDLGEP